MAQARTLAMYLVRKHTDMSYPEIGRLMGKKRHSTVLMAVRRMQELLDREGAVAWKTPSGTQEMSARELLNRVEQRLFRRQDAP